MTNTLYLRSLGDIALQRADASVVLRRRIDLSVLVLLIERSPKPVEREVLQAYFWGERAEDKGRHSLRQVVMRLRESCGDALEVSGSTLRVPGAAILLDAREFSSAAAEGRWIDALDLWTGDFLPGCEHIGGEEFRMWLDVERERLRRLLAHCFERATSEATAAGSWDDATTLATRWSTAFPLDSSATARQIEALCALGRVAEARGAQAAFVRRVRAELDETPDAAWTETNDALISDAAARGLSTPTVRRTPEATVPPPDVATPVRASIWTRRRTLLVAAAGVAAVVVAAVSVRVASARPDRLPAMAVGEITSVLPSDSTRGFATLLTINLARISELNVISERRLSEAAAGGSSRSLDDAARAAGAQELVEGVLSRASANMLRADVRRTDLATGQSRAAYTVEAASLSELADLVTEQLARDFNVRAPAVRKEGVTRSIVAYGFYEQGLRAYNSGDFASARQLFSAALDEDSTFAMAAFYRGMTAEGRDGDSLLARAVRLSQATSDRERLLISATWGRRMSDPRVLAWAETLMTRYPSELDAHLLYAREMMLRGNYSAAQAHFEHVVRMDSVMGRGLPRCRACEGLAGLMGIYSRLDSSEAEIRIGQTRLRLEPKSPRSWSALSGAYGMAGRYADAHAAIDSAVRYSTDPVLPFLHTVWWIRTNDFAKLDRLCRELASSSKPEVRHEALWTSAISLRTQGRMREALDAARQFRREAAGRESAANRLLSEGLLEAVVLTDVAPRAAAALFDSIARVPQAPFPSRVGAHRAMYWTHTATAIAASGDTTRLRALEDSVRVNGALGTERHRALHHYVRGLRLASARKHAEAAVAFRAALADPQETYVRVYLELAKSLIAAGRAGEAVPVLIAALRGPSSASGLYATRTELYDLLASAYELDHQPVKALVQYRMAAEAWRNADPEFAPRRARIASRISAFVSDELASRRRLP